MISRLRHSMRRSLVAMRSAYVANDGRRAATGAAAPATCAAAGLAMAGPLARGGHAPRGGGGDRARVDVAQLPAGEAGAGAFFVEGNPAAPQHQHVIGGGC